MKRELFERIYRLTDHLPPTLAAQIDRLRPSYRAPWGGPLNNQERRWEIVRELAQVARFDLVIETGTYRGTTTEFLSAVFGSTVMTVESNPRYAAYSRRRMRTWPDVVVERCDSRRFLERVADDARLTSATAFFYLDAHWEGDLPLAQELRIIAGSWTRCVVMVDDFEVPGDEGYGYDNYGAGKTLNAGYLPTASLQGWSLFYPAGSSDEETGARRGCCVLAAPDLDIDGVAGVRRALRIP